MEITFFYFCTNSMNFECLSRAVPEPNANIYHEITINPVIDNSTYCLIVCPQCYNYNNIIFFLGSPQTNPSILKVKSIPRNNMTQGKIGVEPFKIFPLTINLNYVNFRYVIQKCYPQDSIDHFCNLMNQIDIPIPGVSISFSSIIQSFPCSSVVSAQGFISINAGRPVRCHVSITYSGILRALLINSAFVLKGSSALLSKFVTHTSPSRIFIDDGEMAYFYAFGILLNVSSVDIFDCVDLKDNAVSVITNIKMGVGEPLFYLSITPSFFYFNNTPVICQTGCAFCSTYGFCLYCNQPYKLSNGKCLLTCKEDDLKINVNNLFCSNNFLPNNIIKLSTNFNHTNLFLTVNCIVDISLHPISITKLRIHLFLFKGKIKMTNYIFPITDKTDKSLIGSRASGFIDITNFMMNNISLGVSFDPGNGYQSLNLTLAIFASFDTISAPNYYPSSPVRVSNFSSEDFSIADYSGFASINTEFFYKFAQILFTIEADPNVAPYLEISFSGNLQIYQNEVLELDSTMDINFTYYSFLKTSHNLFRIEIRNGSYLKIEIPFSYIKLLTFDSLLYYEEFFLQNPYETKPHLPNCEISSNIFCVECKSGYYLNIGACNNYCPTGYKLPISKSCVESCSEDFFIFNQTCYPSCPNSTYYLENSGCKGNCNSKCQTCYGPNISECITCNAGLSQNNDRLCIDEHLYINIIFDQVILVNLVYDSDEFIYGTTITWNATSNSTSAILFSLNTYLNSQSSGSFHIPYDFIEYDTYYVLQASRVFSTGKIISNTTGIFINKPVIIDPIIYLDSSVQSSFQFIFKIGTLNCKSGILVRIQSLDGNSDLNSSITHPCQVTVPRCILTNSGIYNFQIEVSILSYTFTQTFSIKRKSFNLGVVVTGGERSYPFDKTLTLTGEAIFFTPLCPDQLGSTTQMWNCYDLNANNASCDNKISFSQNSHQLTIQDRTFMSTSNIKFVFTYTVGADSVQSGSIVNFGSSSIIPIDLSYNQEYCKPCSIYTLSSEGSIQAIISSEFQLSSTSFTWNIIPSLDSVRYQNKIKIYSTQRDYFNYITISVQVVNGLRSGNASIRLPINPNPLDGGFAIMPLYGFALETNFLLYTFGWIDSQLPLTYYYYNQIEDWNLIYKSNFSNFSTIMPTIQSRSLNIKADIQDSYGASTSISKSIQIFSPDVLDEPSLNYMIDLVNSSNASNVTETIQIIAKSLKAYFSPSVDIQPLYLTLKSLMLTKLADSSNEKIDNKLYALLDLTSTFNSDSTIEQSLNLFNSLKDNLINSNTSSFEELKTLTDIFDNMLTFASNSDCEGTKTLSKQLQEMSIPTLSNISWALQNKKLIGENASVIQESSFDLYSGRVSDCSKNISITTSNFASQALLEKKESSCSESGVLLSYFVFKDSLFTCGGSSNSISKSRIVLNLTDESGRNVLSGYKALIKNQAGVLCQKGCISQAASCFCSNLDMFDVKNQILNLFANSNIKYIANIGALSNWPAYKDPIFWTTFIITIWLVLSLILVKKAWKDLCYVEKYSRHRSKNFFLTLKTLTLVSHSLIGIYCYKDKKLTKSVKASIYYTRMIVMLGFSGIFKTDKANKNSFFVVNPYLLILPYFTFIPFISFLVWTAQEPTKKTRTIKIGRNEYTIKKLFKILITMIFTPAMIFIIYIISANQDDSSRVSWFVDFMKVIIQDSLLTPILFLIQQVFLIKITQKYAKHQFIMKICSKMLSEIYISLRTIQNHPNQISTRAIKRISRAKRSGKFDISNKDNFEK